MPKNPGGRPVKWKTPQEMYLAGETYLKARLEQKKVLKIAGLALALDLSYQGLLEYEEKPQFSETVKKLKTMILDAAEDRLYSNHTTAAIWHTKQLGFKDKSEVEMSGGLSDLSDSELDKKIQDLAKKIKK